MNHIKKIGFALFLLLPTLLFGQFTLKLIEKKIEHDHPIPNISADSLLQQLRSSGANVLLLDTRKPDEFNQSHLQNAVRVDPDISEKKFWAQFGDLAKNKELVFYCSVGKRSSIIAEKLLHSEFADSVSQIYNLRGGIFRWFNSGFTVVNDSGATGSVHPFDRYWGQLLEKRD